MSERDMNQPIKSIAMLPPTPLTGAHAPAWEQGLTLRVTGEPATTRRSAGVRAAWLVLILGLLLLSALTPTLGAPFVGTPNHTSGDYVETTVDIRVKIQGGYASVERSWQNGQWHFNRQWQPLAIIRDPLDNSIKAIERNGDRFEPTANDPDLFRYGRHRRIEVAATGFRWSNRDGEWIHYHSDGRIEAYGGRNGIRAIIEANAEGRPFIVTDHRGEPVLWFDYDEISGRLRRVYDATDREVRYSWNGERLETVTDLRGQDWDYGYSGDLLTSRTDPAGNTVTLSYNGQDRVVEIADELGVWRQYRYDYDKTKKQYLFRVIDGTGVETDNWYDREGALVRREINGQTVQTVSGDETRRRMTNYAGLTTELRFDGRGNLIEVQHPDGSTRTTRWHPRWSLPVQETNENGVVTTYAYDANGNLTRKVEAVGTPAERTTEYSYDAVGNRLTERRLGDARTAEATTTTTYDDWGNVATETDPEGNITRFEYDVMGNVLVRTDPRGKRWTMTYDAAGNQLTDTDPLNQTETFAYDEAGNLISETDRNTHTTTHAYDARNQRISTTDPLDAVTRTEYDLAGRATRMIDALGRVTQLSYDAAGRFGEMIEPGDLRTSFSYATAETGVPFQSPVTKTSPGLVETYGYDRRGRRNRVTQTPEDAPEGTTRGAFDPVGNHLSITDALGRTRSATYDALNRVIAITDKAGGVQRFTWDDRDNLLSVENAREILIREYDYNRNDWMTAEHWPGGGQRRYGQDADGNLNLIIDAKGQRTQHTYDAAGRLVETTLFPDATTSDPARTITYGYDAVGNRTDWTDTGEGANEGITTSSTATYDAVNRKLAEQVDFGPFEAGYSYEYAADGQKIALIYPGGMRVGYGYDNAGRLNQISIPDVGDIEIIEHEHGQPSEWRYPGGMSRSIGYDGLDRITLVHYRNADGETLMEQSIRYDVVGSVAAKSTEHGDYSFSYDVLDRLVEADNPTLADETYGYDPVGNRVASAAQPLWTYGAFDQLLSNGPTEYGYDLNGNLVEQATTAGVTEKVYAYGLRNRLIAAADGTGQLFGSYAYDPEGHRIRRSAADGETHYLYGDDGLLAEFSADGSLIRQHGWRPGRTWGTDPLWMRSGIDVSYPLTDQLGTPWQVADSEGNSVWSMRYASFGESELIAGTPGQNPWRFPGQFHMAELEAAYNFTRHYDPAVGRYHRFDPLGVRAGMNVYAYGLNSPATHIDPLGLKVCIDGTVSGSLVVGSGGTASAGWECCVDDCRTSCCAGVEVCACVGYDVGAGASIGMTIAQGDCSLRVALDTELASSVGVSCGSCSVSASSGTCCECWEQKQCT
ncbi:MAG: RHS repeat protein [Thiohalocapsa sp. PB-PSB1]|nr:MAG: RHS repeat protein [Thiohalocapsa sp. PB-PSB1]